MKKDFIKITVEDLEIAETFFDNDKHFSEFILNVLNYYRGKNIKIKTKIVQKYFETYKKTMDYIIDAKKSGKYGAEIKAENQLINNITLEGSLEAASTYPLSKEEREKKEEERKNIKGDNISCFSFADFWMAYPQKTGKAECQKKYEKLSEADRLMIKETIKDFCENKPFRDYRHPNPLTYINQKRWLDNVDENKQEIPEFVFDWKKHGGDFGLFDKMKAEHDRKYSKQ